MVIKGKFIETGKIQKEYKAKVAEGKIKWNVDDLDNIVLWLMGFTASMSLELPGTNTTLHTWKNHM